MNRMIAITISPGAVTAAPRLDRVGEGLAHHPATRRDQHQEERPEQLREQAPPLLLRSSKSSIGLTTSASNHPSKRTLVPTAACVCSCTLAPSPCSSCPQQKQFSRAMG